MNWTIVQVIPKLIFVLALLSSLHGFAQTGPTNVLNGTTKSYAPATTDPSGSWRLSGGGTLSGASSTGVNVNWTSTGSYTLEYLREITVPGGNLNTLTMYTWYVTVFEIDVPTISVVNNCGSTKLTHNGNQTDVTFYWRVPGSSSYNVSTNPLTVTTPGTYYVRGVHADGSGSVASRAITVNPAPDTSNPVVGNKTYCSTASGASITVLNTNANDTYYLHSSSGSLLQTVSGNNVSVSFSPRPAGTYSVRVGNSSCSTVVLDASVTITSISDAVSHSITTGAAPATSYCTGAVTFSAVGAAPNSTYVWKVNGAQVSTGSTYTPPASAAGSSQDISVTYQVRRPCSQTNATGTATWNNVQLIAPKTPVLNFSPSSNATVCPGTSVPFSFSVTNASNYTYSWNTGVTNSQSINRTINSNNTKTSVSVTVNDACATTTSLFKEVEHDVYPGPNLSNPVVGNKTYCSTASGASISILNTNANDVYSLYNSSGGFLQEVNGNNTSVSFSSRPAGTYSVRVRNKNCTALSVLDSDVRITSIPDNVSHSITTNAAPATSYCTGSVTFSAVNADPASTYSWKINGNEVSTSASFTPNASHVGNSQDISVTYQVKRPCSGVLATGTDTWENIKLTAPFTPVLNFSRSTNETVCKGSTPVSFTITPAGTSYSYQWSNGVTNSQSISPNITTSGTVVSVNVTINDQCSSTPSLSDQVTFNVHADPDLSNPSVAGATYCSTTTGAQIKITSPNAADVYHLYQGSTLLQSKSGSSVNGNGKVVFNSRPQGSYTVKANRNGCAELTLANNVQIIRDQASTWYQDIDGDSYGNPNSSIQACSQPSGYVANNTDCDDTSPELISNCSDTALISGGDGTEVRGTTTTFTTSLTNINGYWTLSTGGTTFQSPTSLDVTWTAGSGSATISYGYDITRYISGIPTSEYYVLGTKQVNLYDLPAPTLTQEEVCDEAIVSHNGSQANVTYFWQTSMDGEIMSNSSNPRSFTSGATHYIRAYHSDGVWGISEEIDVDFSTSPGLARVVDETKFVLSGGSATFEVIDQGMGLTYNWYDQGGALVGTGITYTATGVAGDMTLFVEAENTEGCTSVSRTPMNVILIEGSGYNWIQSIDYRSSQKITETRSYYDMFGKPIQVQNRLLSENNMMVSATIYDELNRPAAQSLSAPTGSTSFGFDEEFLSDIASPGNLKWYYSTLNNWEEETDITDNPFILTEYYDDGSGDVKTNSGPLEQANVNMKVYSRNFPVMEELDDHYSAVRDALLGYISGSLKGEVYKTVTKDGNGNEDISFVDGNEQVLITAKGYLSSEDNGIPWNLTFSYDATLDNIPELYFHIPEGTSISAPENVTEMVSDVAVSGTIGQGFYQYSDPETFTYDYTYFNASFNFYDDKGQLIVSVPPKGVEDILSRTVTSIDAEYVDDIPFATYFSHDFQGRILEMNEPDVGVTRYMYRADGLIRFSENELQRNNGTFSYTNYDNVGRPIESGEYVGSAFQFGSAALIGVLEARGFDGGFITEATDRKDWIRTHYDLPDNDPTAVETFGNDLIVSSPVAEGNHLLKAKTSVKLEIGFSHIAATQGNLSIRTEGDEISVVASDFEFDQKFTFGAVSYTETPNVKTWNSYDEQGRVAEIYTWYKYLLDAPKHIEYEYDFLGNIIKIRYEAGEGDAFYHAYEYDHDNRISSVYAATSETEVDSRLNSALQAKYYYYLHGPLKRVELAENLQGIDYIYNIAGQLKSINDVGNLTDEAGFLQDAFAQRYEYFSGDYLRSSVLPQSTPETETYNGSIAGVIWSNRNTSGVYQAGEMQYQYDRRDFLKNAIFDNTATFNNQSQKFRLENLTYDGNGNILSLRRKDASGNNQDNFTSYDYRTNAANSSGSLSYNTNQLASIPNFSSWSYDAVGQVTSQLSLDGSGEELKMIYDVNGRVIEIFDENDDLKLSYEYNYEGFRIRTVNHENGTETLYVRDATGRIQGIYHNEGGYVIKENLVYGADRLGTYFHNSGDTEYQLKDHLGNVRNTVSRLNRESTYYGDYYPFGSVMRAQGIPGRFGYQGDFAEQDPETGLNYFEARFYNSKIGRWLSVDPARQGHTPYWGMDNDPIRLIDPDGEDPIARILAALKLIGKSYKREPNLALRTAETDKALEYIDCTEATGRIMAFDKITDGVKWFSTQPTDANSKNIREYFLENDFIISQTPKKGDFMLFKSHMSFVFEVADDGTNNVKALAGLKGGGTLVINGSFQPASIYGNDFIGYVRPKVETSHLTILEPVTVTAEGGGLQPKGLDDID